MEKLIKKAQNGNDRAFLTLFQTYEQDVYRMAFVYVKNQNDALDVVQETAYRSFKTIQNLTDTDYFKTWLIRIAINCSIDLLRKRKNVIQLDTAMIEDFPSAMKDQIDLKVTLNELMEELTEIEKSVVLLRFYQGLTFEETAEVLDIPLGTSKTILYRSLKKLRKNLKGADFYE